MPKIITVTANTAIDLNIIIDNLNSSDNIIAHASQEYAAGKGINVAKALESLACPSIALGFVGQQSQNFFANLKSELLQPDFIPIQGRTRTNITLRELNPDRETHIRTMGFSITTLDCVALQQQLQQYVHKDDLVIFSGSLPPGCPEDFYAELITICQKQQAITLLDSSGKNLTAGITARPDVIKPNQSELEELMGQTLPDTNSIIHAARSLTATGIKIVTVSRRELGVIVVTANTAITAHVEPAISNNASSTIGCGDAMVAGLAYATLHQQKLADMIKLSLGCATANLFSSEPGRFDLQHLEAFMAQVIIEADPRS